MIKRKWRNNMIYITLHRKLSIKKTDLAAITALQKGVNSGAPEG
jgi:hypothetical protein